MKLLMGLFRVLWLVLGAGVFFILTSIVIGPGLGSTRPSISTLERDGRIVIAAIDNYRNDHKALPESLDQLVPEYLTKLNKVTYCYQKYYEWPHKLFSGYRKSHWAYKTSYDKRYFALGVEARPLSFYDSKTGEWEFQNARGGFVNYDKAPVPADERSSETVSSGILASVLPATTAVPI